MAHRGFYDNETKFDGTKIFGYLEKPVNFFLTHRKYLFIDFTTGSLEVKPHKNSLESSCYKFRDIKGLDYFLDKKYSITIYLNDKKHTFYAKTM